MRVVLTRPRQEAERWAARLHARGHEALVLPLLAIVAPQDLQPLRAAAAALARYAAVMFVSANAVQGLLAVAPAFEGPRAWAPGLATRDALRGAGVPAERIDTPAADAEQFDSESLWREVGGQLQPGDRLLLVRGGDSEGRSQGRDWLAQQLAARGVAVDTVVAYLRQCPSWSEEEQGCARRAAGDGSPWLFSSSEAVGNLATLLPGQSWAGARAIATHPRIAQAVRALGFGTVRESRPAFDEVVASIELLG
ncbi:uroporphyrinogen-III synthase [Ramlibacter alkalitolerans]|uniref:Uroporphyrinogen-III synthase n=1 Tax=Ramlibacter alkalitolerans TaxID=2039631 RepID=A0ABS1JPC9_9BURK|nr:uroporphyrinogen-III synthase [Ramlibacter alkalitolerans]MBL0426113.1 uroporphyrinogen-III synthase [Ramlibacter alkalitolerans]